MIKLILLACFFYISGICICHSHLNAIIPKMHFFSRTSLTAYVKCIVQYFSLLHLFPLPISLLVLWGFISVILFVTGPVHAVHKRINYVGTIFHILNTFVPFFLHNLFTTSVSKLRLFFQTQFVNAT